MMKSRNRVLLTMWLVRVASSCLSAPSSAQKGEIAVLSAKIAELSRAGKYAEATTLAQRQLESLEKTRGPLDRDVAGALNNLTQLYGDQGNDAAAEPLLKRSIAIMEKAAGLDSLAMAPERNNLAACTSDRNAMPMPNRCSSARWRCARSRFHPTILMSGSR